MDNKDTRQQSRPAGTATRPRTERWGKGRYEPKRKVCGFCADKGKTIDYKDAITLRRYITNRAKIAPRRKTGTCARHQREIALAIKRARHLALLPFVPEHIYEMGGFEERD